MDISDLLSAAGGNSSLTQLAGQLGLGAGDMSKLVASVSPAITESLKKQVTAEGGLPNLQKALANGNHQKYVDDPASMNASSTLEDGNKILGHLFGSKDVSRNVAAHAAESAGLDTNVVKSALPMIASLVMGAMSKKTSAGQQLDSGMGGMLGGLLDSDGDGVDLDDVLGLARKFF